MKEELEDGKHSLERDILVSIFLCGKVKKKTKKRKKTKRKKVK